MNPKTIRYVLIGGVVFTWGTILLKVLTASGNDTPHFPSLVPASTAGLAIVPDTFSLLANYSDPFLDSAGFKEEIPITIKQGSAETVNSLQPSQPLPPAPVDVSFIKYLGMIANPEQRKKAGLVSIKGREKLLKEGERVDDIIIRKISADRITIVYKGETITIGRQ